MATSKEVAILKKYAPKCNIKGCNNDCQIAWDSYGKINFDHCHDCHFAYAGKGFYISEVVHEGGE